MQRQHLLSHTVALHQQEIRGLSTRGTCFTRHPLSLACSSTLVAQHAQHMVHVTEPIQHSWQPPPGCRAIHARGARDAHKWHHGRFVAALSITILQHLCCFWYTLRELNLQVRSLLLCSHREEQHRTVPPVENIRSSPVSGFLWANLKVTTITDIHLVHLQDSHNRPLHGRLSVCDTSVLQCAAWHAQAVPSCVLRASATSF